MKNKLGILLSTAIATTAFAQEGKTGKQETYPFPKENKGEQTITPQQQGSREYYVMRDKKLIHVKDNVSDEVAVDVTLSNGTKITTKGELISRTGKREMLEDGQCVDVTATVSFCEALPGKIQPEKKSEEPDRTLPEDKEKGKKTEPGNK